MIVRGNEIATLNGYVNSMINNVPKSGALIVTITDNNGTLSADMTFSEILNAINAGISVLVYYNSNYLPFMSLLDGDLRFGSSWCVDSNDLDDAAVSTLMIEITEKNEVIDFSDLIDIPKTLPNPNAITFTGAVTGSYDGSAPLSVEIPNGADGYSPTANVTQNDNGATITITDKNGTTTATVTNGKDGSPVNWRGAWEENTEYSKLDAVSYDGSSYIFKSDTRVIGSFPGIDEEWELMTQKGNDGHTPVKGKDYWTEADKQEIVNDVLAALPDGSEVSY